MNENPLENKKDELKDLEHNDLKDNFSMFILPEDITSGSDVLKTFGKKEFEFFSSLKKKLKDSVLIDLGCGNPVSVDSVYKFATLFGVRKLIGIEKYPDESVDNEGYIGDINFIKKGEKMKEILQKNQDLKFPECEFYLKTDMLSFLENRTEKSNFVLSGIDSHILNPINKPENKSKDYIAYINKLQEKLAQLTQDNGVIMSNYSLINMEKFGFKKKYLFKKEDNIIWEKV